MQNFYSLIYPFFYYYMDRIGFLTYTSPLIQKLLRLLLLQNLQKSHMKYKNTNLLYIMIYYCMHVPISLYNQSWVSHIG